ncbi:MAG: hypothetical protein ACLP0J_09360 [Solirubrobacteraceae bacterium]
MRNLKRRSVAAIVGLAALLVTASSALAAGVADVNASTNTAGLPGIGRAQAIVGGLITFGVIASAAGVLTGALVWAWSRTNSDPGEGR